MGSRAEGRRKRPRPLIQILADGVACDVHVRSFDIRERSATYELIISNETDVGVCCRLYGIDASAHTREFGMLAIGKKSTGKSFSSLPLDTRDRRVFVEIVGEGVSLFAEAIQPKAQGYARWPRSALALVLLSSAAAIGTLWLMEKPSIEGLITPTFTAPGSVTAIYAIRGFASVRYSATWANGRVLAMGTLAAPSGEITIRVPAMTIGHVVRFLLDASGPLGHSVRASDVRVVASRITEGSMDRVRWQSNTPKTIRESGSRVALTPSSSKR